MTEKFSPQNCNIVRNSEHSASKKNLTLYLQKKYSQEALSIFRDGVSRMELCLYIYLILLNIQLSCKLKSPAIFLQWNHCLFVFASGTQVSNTFACLQSLGTKWFLHPLPTLQNKKPVPQVLKQVVNLSCYLWNPGFEMGFSPYWELWPPPRTKSKGQVSKLLSICLSVSVMHIVVHIKVYFFPEKKLIFSDFLFLLPND